MSTYDIVRDAVVLGYDEKGRPIASLPENAAFDDMPENPDPEADPVTPGEWANLMERDVVGGSHGKHGRKRTKQKPLSEEAIREARRRTHGV